MFASPISYSGLPMTYRDFPVSHWDISVTYRDMLTIKLRVRLYGIKEVREVKAIFGPHAQKGQKLLAQGSALGYYVRKVVAL